MTAGERILALKLLQRQKENPEYMHRLGIQVKLVENHPKKREE